jgi:hypothetical protein
MRGLTLDFDLYLVFALLYGLGSVFRMNSAR